MKRNFTLVVLFSCQALVAGLALFLHFVTRPSFAKVYADFGGPIPAHAQLALSSWYLPSLAAFAVLCDAAALALRKRSARNFALGLGLVIPAFGLAFAVHGIFVPLFQTAPMP